MAISRNKGIERRVNKGDLARIYLTENNQYVLKRSVLLLQAENQFVKAANFLSLFNRSDTGSTVIAAPRTSFE